MTMLINNAGSIKLSTLADTSAAEGEAMIALNVAALILLTQAILPNQPGHDRQYRIGAGPAFLWDIAGRQPGAAKHRANRRSG